MNQTTLPAQGPVDVNVRGWMPIETAPKDGTEFIVFYPSFTSQRGWCYGEDITSARYEKGELVSFSDYTPATPTHWMPLPESPNAKVRGCAHHETLNGENKHG